MPSSETAAERRAAKAQQMGAALPPVEHDPLPCPRCESSNTKFCYYNNYNFSQPRHFCKSCRRYWTHGGTLRDIPVGGGSRKTAKRSRTSSSSNSATSSYSSAGSHHHHQHSQQQLMLHEPIPATPVFVSLSSPSPINAVSGGGSGGGGGGSGGGGGGFTSLLSSAGPGILSLGGFGLGFEEVGFGLGRGVWAFPDMGYVSSGGMGGGGGGGVGGASGGDGEECGGGGMSREDTWHVGSGESGFGVGVGVGGDCFTSLPELAISTPGNGRN